MKYKYSKKAGNLQEAFEQDEVRPVPMPQQLSSMPPPQVQQPASAWRDEAVVTAERALHSDEIDDLISSLDAPAEAAVGTQRVPPPASRAARRSGPPRDARQQQAQHSTSGQAHDMGLDTSQSHQGQSNMLFYTVEDGQRVLVVEQDGSMQVVEGPARIWRWRRQIRAMRHYVAHPGDFLMVRYRDGRQEHLIGPAHLWLDPREHISVTREEALPISAKEAVVVYSEDEETSEISRRIAHGPALFVPRPGEWLHTFSWHGTAPGVAGYRKVPNALVFQKLWLMPDQMYHDVTDVRTSDDALLTIRLMLFFELRDIEQMLATTHDPIGDFINAATSDIIEFVSRHDFESFKQSTEKLNDLETYGQLTARADQAGYHINKVVYRGYGAPERLQKMHDQAIESRTRLQLERATETQAQELEDFKLERDIARAARTREDGRSSLEHELEMERKRRDAELEELAARRAFTREQTEADEHARLEREVRNQQAQQEHLARLAELGVDLTALLTQGRADRVIELRGGGQKSVPHLHVRQDD